MVDGLLVALVLINVYIVALFVLHQRGKLRGPTFEMVGPILMWRTEKGKQLIDRISRPQRFWRAYGDLGVILTWISGFAVLALLLYQLSLLFTKLDVLKQVTPGPEYYLVLPGVNPLIPLWYGIIGLVVALVVHEGAHGVLARAHNIKVKSLGLLTVVVPIGAFVEPDDEELEKASTRIKARVFAAGVMANLTFAFIAALLFSSVFWASAVPAHDGMALVNVTPGNPAADAGIVPGMILTSVDGQPVHTTQEFNASLASSVPNQRVTLGLWYRGNAFSREVTLADKYAYFASLEPPVRNESYRGRGFLGVSTIPMASFSLLRDQLGDPVGGGRTSLALYIALPFAGYSPMPESFQSFYQIQGPLGALPPVLFWIFADVLYWIFWLNLMVGTFNALPAGPLDGGQMFKASLKGALRRYFGVRRDQLVVERVIEGQQVVVRGTDAATQAKVERIDSLVRRTTLAIGLTILWLILAPIIGPRLL